MPEQLGVSANILALPAAGASVVGLAGAFEADLYSGTGAFDIPISVPPAACGFAPDLILRYSSGAGAGPFGQGWRLPLGVIQRQTRFGFPTYDGARELFTLNGSDDLVPVEDDLFRPSVDTAGSRIRRLGDHWEVTDKNGVRQLLGTSANCRIEHNATARVFAWLLAEIVTPGGQRATFTYEEDGAGRHISAIDYGPFQVAFEYEASASARADRRPGFLVPQRRRCRQIEIRSRRAVRPVLRRYRLHYREGVGRDLLETVELEAGDGATFAAMPALHLDYTRSPVADAQLKEIEAEDLLPRLGGADVDLIDLTGDGRPGLIRGSDAGWLYWPNLGDGRFGAARRLEDVPTRLTLDRPEVQFADLEGNGTADLLWGEVGRQGYFPNAAGGSWEPFRTYLDPLPFALSDSRFRLYDTDGDGRIDGVFTGPDALLIYFNLGAAGWSAELLRTPRISDASIFPDVSFSDPHIFTGDMTGDGLTDIVEIRDGRVCYWPYLDRGKWGARVEMTGAPVIGPGFDPSRFRLIDVNADGAVDLVLLEADAVRVWTNHGGRELAAPVTISVPGLDALDAVVVDLLAEGRPGLLMAGPDPVTGNQRYSYLSFGTAHSEAFLSTISTDLGHVTRIGYGLSSEHRRRSEARGEPWKSFLPFAAVVVDSITVEDRPGRLRAVTHFDYADGHFDGIERSFNGFGSVVRRIEGDPSQPGLDTRAVFHAGAALDLTEADRRAQDPRERLMLRSLRGSPLMLEESSGEGDGDEKLLSRTVNSYAARVDHEADGRRVAVPYAILAETDEIGEGAIRRTQVRRAPPDRFLNTNRMEYVSGRVDPASDEFTPATHKVEQIRYVDPPAVDATFWAPGLRCEETLETGAGETLQCIRTLFDGPEFEGLPIGQATKGAISRIEELVYDATERPENDARLAATGHHFVRPGAGDGARDGWYRNRLRYKTAPDGRPLEVMDPAGSIAAIGYDQWGIDPVRVVDAAGLATTATHDRQVELVASVSTPDGVTEYRTYDSLGRTIATSRTSALGDLSVMSVTVHDPGDFGPGGNATRPPTMTSVYPEAIGRNLGTLLATAASPDTAGAAKVVRRVYSACGLELETIASAARAENGLAYVRTGAREYNSRSRLRSDQRPLFTSSIAPALDYVDDGGPSYSRVYDALGRETLLRFPSGKRRQEFAPFETRVVDANADAAEEDATSIRRFDAEGRQIRAIGRIGGGLEAVHRFEYSSSGWLAGILDPSGDLILSIQRDRLGRNIRVQHRDCGAYSYEYDVRGALIRTEHPAGGFATYSYDSIARLVAVEEHGADGSLLEARRLYYDEAPDRSVRAPGRLCAVEDAAGLTIFDYDVAGRLSSKHRRTPDGRSLRLEFEHDYQGRVIAIVYPDGTRITYGYGVAGELTTVDGFIDDIAYDARGRPEFIRYANGVDTHIGYDAAERISRVHSTRQGSVLADFTCGYDRVGNVVELGSSIEGAPEESKRLEYDGLNRLVRSLGKRGAEAFDFALDYDAAGNLLKLPEHGLEAMGYEDESRPGLLTSLRWADGRTTLRTYDAGGRLIASERFQAVAYDSANRTRLVELSGGGHVELSYDHFGRRAATVASAADGQAVRSLFFDGLYEETGDEQLLHVRGPGGLIGRISVRAGSAERRLHHTDAQGNLRFTTDASGRIVSRHSYTSFGMELPAGGQDGRFAGKIGDSALNMIQLGARFYEPLTGRFTTPDLLIIERPEAGLADPVTYNAYAYAINNPHRFHDPSGRFPWVIVIGAVIGAIIGYNTAKENGTDPWVGAVFGALVGGLTGGAGLLKGALIGAALGAVGASQSGEKVWSGAAVGFLFGAVSGAVSQWLPAAGEGGWTKLTAGLMEVAADGLVAGAAAGVDARLHNKSFEDGFRSGALLGASLSALKVLALGARTSPAAMNKNLDSGLQKEWARQGLEDKHNYLSGDVAKGGLPDTSKVTFRSGGFIHELNGGRSFVGPGSVQMGPDAVADLKNGRAEVLAHELRHIAQQEAATFGFAEFIVVWLFQSATSNHQYQTGPANNTLETGY